jgi:hypothetical protein
MIGRDALAVSSAFNAKAAREGWGSRCETQLEFHCPELSAIHTLWREKAGTRPIPARQDFSLRCVKTYLRDVAIYERTVTEEGRCRYRVRLMGTTFAETMGDLTGKYLDEAIPESFLPRWYAALDATLDAGVPLRFVARSDTAGKSYLVAEYFEAPLLDDNGAASMVLACSHFSALATSTELVAGTNIGPVARSVSAA